MIETGIKNFESLLDRQGFGMVYSVCRHRCLSAKKAERHFYFRHIVCALFSYTAVEKGVFCF